MLCCLLEDIFLKMEIDLYGVISGECQTTLIFVNDIAIMVKTTKYFLLINCIRNLFSYFFAYFAELNWTLLRLHNTQSEITVINGWPQGKKKFLSKYLQSNKYKLWNDWPQYYFHCIDIFIYLGIIEVLLFDIFNLII